MKFRTRDLCYIAMTAVLIAVCSWISVPTVVPFTLQTFAVFCALELLGLALCYAFGTLWFVEVYSRANGALSVMTALGWCVLPFLLPDALKLALALLLSARLKPLLKLDQ